MIGVDEFVPRTFWQEVRLRLRFFFFFSRLRSTTEVRDNLQFSPPSQLARGSSTRDDEEECDSRSKWSKAATVASTGPERTRGGGESGAAHCDRRANHMPAMKSKPLDMADQAVESELALLVSEYLQFHHCTGAYEVSAVNRDDAQGDERRGDGRSFGRCECRVRSRVRVAKRVDVRPVRPGRVRVPLSQKKGGKAARAASRGNENFGTIPLPLTRRPGLTIDLTSHGPPPHLP